jgi:hypothetical protein
VAVQPGPIPTEPIEPEQGEPEPGGTNARQRLLILGAAGLALVLLLLVPLLAGRGADTPVVVGTPSTSGGTGVTGTTKPGGAGQAATPAPTTTTPPVAEAAALTAKDPFKPLVAAAGSGTPAGSDILPSSGGDSGVTTTTSGASGTTPGGGTSTASRLTLVDVFRSGGVRYVKVQLDGKSYQAAEGGTVAGAYRVVDIGTSCAEFRSSNGAVFTLCEGEAVLK